MEQDKKRFEMYEHARFVDLAAFLRYMLRRFKVIATSVILGILIAAIYVFVLATPIYEATAQIYVVNSKDSVLNLSDLQIGSYLTSDYQLVFKTWEVNQEVIQNLGLPYSVKELKEMLTVSNPEDTRALFITVESRDAAEAAAIANEYAYVASQYISETMLTDTPTVLSVALEESEPVKPQKALVIAGSALLCALIAAFVLFGIYMRDDRIRTAEDVMKYTGDMPLAVIPVANAPADRRMKRR